MVSRRRSKSTGFEIQASASIAGICSGDPAAVTTTTGISAMSGSLTCARRNCQPFITGIIRSSRITHVLPLACNASSACFPLAASRTSKPSSSRNLASISRVSRSSSTINTDGIRQSGGTSAPGLLDERVQRPIELDRIDRLDQNGIAAGAIGTRGIARERRVTRHGQHGHRRRAGIALQPTRELVAVDAGQMQLGHDGVGPAIDRTLERLEAVVRLLDVKAGRDQLLRAGAAPLGIVIDQ